MQTFVLVVLKPHGVPVVGITAGTSALIRSVAANYTTVLLLLSRFSRVRLCDPTDGSPPAPLSLGFSRQEYWSGLPFPSPTHASEKWKWSRSVVSDSSRPHGLQPTRLLRPWDFPGKSTGVGATAFSTTILVVIIFSTAILLVFVF